MQVALDEIIDDLRRRIAELERRVRFQSVEGTIAEVDVGRRLARVKLRDGDQPFLTGWIPWAEAGAGQNKTSGHPSEGEQVRLSSGTGDLHDAVIICSLSSDANPAPAAPEGSYVLASVGGVSLTVSGEGLAVVGGGITHNGTDIGDTHTHGGVMSGPSSTDKPN